MSQVVIISSKEDAHVPFVARHLNDSPIIIDSQAVIDGCGLTYAFSRGVLHVVYAGKDITDTRGIWLRRPMHAESWDLPVADHYKKYARSALMETLNSLFVAFPDATWISDHYAILRAENKPLQQNTASRLGFYIPETIYTSDPLEARHFMKKHKNTVVKSLAAYHPKGQDGRRLAFFTRNITNDKAMDLEGLRVAPGVFQEAIEVGYEVRVTVVKNRVFAARIHLSGQPHENIRDWRLGHFEGDIAFEPYELDVLTKQRCIDLVARMRLNYGAIDLIYDTKGTVWFLEINPNGQWAFIEKATGQSIGASIAACLENRDR